ncbi:hypothetical protein CALVIDRAFT_538744 [Calocera viscosa TUFC12733]|uniref:Uncharacterized protein n=1 Tax=Calocera viscosa (strain TUFC12733) TaxID=1330018 RepID=A0A167KGB2_CALVF|nr:hypothetical protein CALVIDRAFT_538744 [Calocera viscosa TUFC12733]
MAEPSTVDPGPKPTGIVEQALWLAAQRPRIPTDEATVKAIVEELKACGTEEAFGEICKRIEASVYLTYQADMSSGISRELYGAIQRLKVGYFGVGKDTGQKMDDDCKAYLAQEVHLAFQPPPPVPVPNAHPVQLTFVDVTAQHRTFGEDDVWAPEVVDAALDEPWDDAFFRLRTQANRKYRHPYLPAVTLNVLRAGTEVRIGRTELAFTVSDHLATQGGATEVQYIHADDDHYTAQNAWAHSPELRKFTTWTRELPEWFKTPETWVDPVPPASFSLPERPSEGFWVAVPTLCFPVSGRLPLPGTTTPDRIAKVTYIAARSWPNQPEPSPYISIEKDQDVCLPADRLVPPLTVEQATSLLGRMVQWSDLEPGQESYKNKYQSRELDFAYALDTVEMKLYMRNPHGQHQSAYTLDLTETAQSVHTWKPNADGTPRKEKEHYRKGEWGLRARVCMWVGPVTLPADRDALGIRTGGTEDKKRRKEAHKAAYHAFINKVRGSIKLLNAEEMTTAPFEVGKDGTLLVGDIHACRGLNDFTNLKNVRPGVWKSWFTWVGPDSEHAQYEGGVEAVHMQFLSDGNVDYTNPPASPQPSEEAARLAEELESAKWERLCTLSVDAGGCGIIARSALSKGGFLRSKLVEIDTILETLADGGSDSMYLSPTAVPGGIVCPSGPGDGGYDVLGKKDAQGRVVRVMCDFWTDWMKRQDNPDDVDEDDEDESLGNVVDQPEVFTGRQSFASGPLLPNVGK